MSSGRDEYLEKKCIDYEAENAKRFSWLEKTGGAAQGGLTVRDYFAAKALGFDCYGISSAEAIALKAYRIADAMMKVREIKDLGEDDSIDNLDLTVRAENVLKSEGILTITELVERTKYDILKIPNCGMRTLKEIVTALHKRGQTLRGLA